MLENQTTIFEMLYPTYKITKPIRLIELFAGYGSQALALKYLGVDFEHWKICEWAIKSIQAYKDIHFTDSFCGRWVLDIPKEQIIDFLYKKEISSNYNEPMKLEQIKKLKEQQLYNIYENIIITNNLVNVQKVKGKDLEIVDTNNYDYILTYSFPCQDLSLAGLGKGMSNTSTRSGLLWEVERILTECKELNTLPQILLMENVPQVHGEGNVEDFNKWQLRLEELGYKNYCQDLIATDYGIPQTRNRTFMISILGDYNYTFPKPIPLKLKLKDMLEDNVDEKYYLSDAMIKYITKNGEIEPKQEFNVIDSYNKHLTNSDYSGCVVAGQGRNQGSMLMIKNATEKGYIKANDGNGIDLLQPNSETRRGRVQKNAIQTLDTMGGNGKGVVVKPKVLSGYGKIGSTGQYHQQNRIYDDNVSISLTTAFNPYYKNELIIRKLTPRECFRLMGVKDTDFDKMKDNQSDNSLYHLAGDSIVVNVLMALFKMLME